FEKIKATEYQNYYYEPFAKTLERYQREDALNLWKQGMVQKLFIPEFHGREHLNVPVWLRALQQKDPHTLMAFEEGCWGFQANLPHGINYQAAFDVEIASDIDYHATVFKEGL